MVSYDGRPMIESTVGRGKPALILLIFIVGILFLTISYDYYPSPRLLNMDAAFAFSCTWRSLMVSYDGRPMIDSTVGWGKPALILLIFIVGILFLTISYDYY